jgi:hypothetical protein
MPTAASPPSRSAAGLSRSRPPPAYVVGAAELAAAVPFVPRPGMIRIGDDELRGASAQIVELYVLPGSSDPQLDQRLADRYAATVHTQRPVEPVVYQHSLSRVSARTRSMICSESGGHLSAWSKSPRSG